MIVGVYTRTVDITYWGFRCPVASRALTRRADFLSALRVMCDEQPDLFASEMIYGELVGNVVRHSPGPIEVRLERDPANAVTLHVIDSGEPFEAATYSPDDPWGESGRGLFLINAFGSTVEVKAQDGGKCVSARLPGRCGE